MVYMLPCTAPEKPLATCPDYDPKTEAEREAEKAAMSEHMDKVLVVMKEAGKWRDKMVANNLSRASVTCPSCGAKNAMKVSCAVGYNNHIHCRCSECDIGFIE